MKKILFGVFVLISCRIFSQAPDYLNYQGVARGATNNIISTTIGLKFEIIQGNTTGTIVYTETNTSLPSSAGIFTAAIGAGSASVGTFSLINWANGPYFIRVSMDPAGGTSYSTIGTSQLLSVPYALYAKTAGSGSAMPSGTLTGQTLYWNNAGNNWVVNNNILNDGQKVIIGDATISSGNKMKVVSYTPLDSSALFVYHPNAIANEAAIRGFASGSAVNSGSLNIDPIIGGHFIGYNINNAGSAVGAVGQGISPAGDAVGLIAIASSSSSLGGRSVGLYASGMGPNYINNYAAIFDRGKVFVNDTLIINTNGNIGDVLTRGINGKSHWQATGAGLWVKPTASVVTLNANSDNVGIGTSSPLAKLHVVESLPSTAIIGANTNTSSSFNAHGVQGTSQSSHTISAGVYGSHGSNGFGVYAINTNSSSPSGSGAYALTMGTTTNNVGIRGDAANGSAIGVMGMSFANGASVYGLKTNTAPLGNAGKFENQNPSNTSDAILAINAGSGAAVHAFSSTLTTSALSLLLENGHIKAAGPPIGITSTSVTGGFGAITGAACTNCNDVRGTVSFSTGVTGFSAVNYAEVTITFLKPYGIIPNVSLTPLTDLQDLNYIVANTTVNGFSVRIYRSSNKSVPLSIPTAGFKFNYVVIE